MSRSQIFMQNSGFDKNDNLCNLLSTHLLIKRLKSLNWDNIIAIGSTVAKQQLYLPKSSYGDQCHKLVTAKLMICAKCLTLQKLFKNFAVIFCFTMNQFCKTFLPWLKHTAVKCEQLTCMIGATVCTKTICIIEFNLLIEF